MMSKDNKRSQRENASVRHSNPSRRRSDANEGRYLHEEPTDLRYHRNPSRRNRRKQKLTYTCIALAGIVVILICIILGVRTFAKPSIVGRWDLDGTTVYEFRDDGTGTLILMIKECDFTYTVEGDVLRIFFVDKDAALDAEYTFEVQKRILFLTGGHGDAKNEHVLTRKSLLLG